MSRPSVGELWYQARREFPLTKQERKDGVQMSDIQRERFRELMLEHGHLIPGKPTPLPCGWPHKKDG